MSAAFSSKNADMEPTSLRQWAVHELWTNCAVQLGLTADDEEYSEAVRDALATNMDALRLFASMIHWGVLSSIADMWARFKARFAEEHPAISRLDAAYREDAVLRRLWCGDSRRLGRQHPHVYERRLQQPDLSQGRSGHHRPGIRRRQVPARPTVVVARGALLDNRRVRRTWRKSRRRGSS